MNFNSDSIIIKSLENSFQNDKLSHAYLVVGEDSLYSDYFIMNFVKAIFCENNKEHKFHSCGECTKCRSIDHGNYVDFYKVEATSSIKKEEIQQLKSELSIKSFYGRKVYWIKDVEKMTQQAANSLLKFLEEPSDDIVAILSCSNTSAVLPTIISRCQQLKLSGKSEEEVVEVDEESEKLIATYLERFSRKPHLANIYLLGELKDKENILKFFEQLSRDLKNSFATAQKVDYQAISNVQEKVLAAIFDINMNVASVLVLEKFLFSIILERNSLDFLMRGKYAR